MISLDEEQRSRLLRKLHLTIEAFRVKNEEAYACLYGIDKDAEESLPTALDVQLACDILSMLEKPL